MKAIQFAFVPFRVVILLLLTTILAGYSHAGTSSGLKIPTDEQLITVVLEVGPFFVNSRYRGGGEGPGRIRDISIKELIANRKTVWVEPRLGMNKRLEEINRDNPGFKGALGTQEYKEALAAQNLALETATQHTSDQNRMNQVEAEQRLYWIRGAKVEIIDDGKVLPHAEFLCHSIISLDESQHQDYFPKRSKVTGNSMFNFSQGSTNFIFPEGFGIPMNNNERLKFNFRILNRTSDETSLIKGRWTLYFVADNELTRPIKALSWYRAGIAILVGKDTTPPNDMWHLKLKKPFAKNVKGEKKTWHWVVPPGRHTYRTMHSQYHFDFEGPILAATAHVHPFAEKMSLIELMPDREEKIVFTINSQTDTSHGIRIMNIDYLTWPSNSITLSKDKNVRYGWEVTYNNTSEVDVDSMAGATLYFSDLKFEKPAWAHDSQTAQQ